MVYKSEVPCLVGPNNTLLTKAKDKADLLNEFFCSVFTVDNNIHPQWNIQQNDRYLSFVEFSSINVYFKLIRLPNKISPGPDFLPQKLLKELAVSLAEPLSLLFTFSFNNSILPTIWKKANVTPLYKNKGSSNIPNNYRPISLTSVVCKVMESIIVDKIKAHCMPSIFPGQHAYLEGKSTVTQLLETLYDWTLSIDQGHVIDVLYLDIAKAFDSVSHTKLISKLYKNGICGLLLDWIKAFLSGRDQRVVIDGIASSYKPVTSGVPQGSTLGPVLFMIYINDLPNVVKFSTVKLFADDCKIYFAFKRKLPSNSLQEDINSIAAWAEESQLGIAMDKCAMLHLGYRNPKQAYFFGNQQITLVNSIRDLGIIISDNLKFHEHFSNLVKKASSSANLIFKCFECKKHDFLVQMFNTFVRSKLEYGTQVWNPHYLCDIDLLENVQRKFTKRINGLWHKSYPERLAILNMQSLELRRLHLDLIFLYKIIHGQVKMDFKKCLFSSNHKLVAIVYHYTKECFLLIYPNFSFAIGLWMFGTSCQMK